MQNFRVSLSFAGLPDADLDEFASKIIASLTGNAAYPTPAVSLADLGTLQSAFHHALTAAAQGGTQLTAAKNQAREALVDALRKEAAYVQGLASHDLSLLLTSGFEANSTNRAQNQLETPVILSLDNGMSTQLVARLQAVANAKAYEVRINTGNTPWQDMGTFTQARRIVLTNLTPGSSYTVQARAIGGSTGQSDWSDPVSHMAM